MDIMSELTSWRWWWWMHTRCASFASQRRWRSAAGRVSAGQVKSLPDIVVVVVH